MGADRGGGLNRIKSYTIVKIKVEKTAQELHIKKLSCETATPEMQESHKKERKTAFIGVSKLGSQMTALQQTLASLLTEVTRSTHHRTPWRR